jgi:hypothetical protein
MERLRTLALGMIITLNAIATVVSFGESYFGLYRWATEHGVAGFWGGVWPMMVDLIILVAEAALFVAHHDKWKTRHKAWLWSVMFTALGVSTGANTGHVHSTDYLSHLTAALPPVALMFTMTVGFGVMKRTFMNKPEAPARPAERVHVGTAPWIESPVLAASHVRAETPLTPVAETSQPAVSQPETPDVSPAETLAPETLSETPGDSTMIDPNMKMIPGKSFTAPKDPRQGLSLPELRVRDMYDVNPDISVNAVAQALGVAWATANKHLNATKEARLQTA